MRGTIFGISVILSAAVALPGAAVFAQTQGQPPQQAPYVMQQNDAVAVCTPGGIWLNVPADIAAQIVAAVGIEDDAALSQAIAGIVQSARQSTAQASVVPITNVSCTCAVGTVPNATSLASAIAAFAISLAPDRQVPIIAGAVQAAPADQALIQQAASCVFEPGAGPDAGGGGGGGGLFPARAISAIGGGGGFNSGGDDEDTPQRLIINNPIINNPTINGGTLNGPTIINPNVP